MTDTLPDPRHPRLSSDRFYWAKLQLDAPAELLRRNDSPAARLVLDEAFAAHLPVDISRVATAYAPLESGVLACGLPLALVADYPDAVTIAPETLPDWLADAADPEYLNVLVGPHQPPAVTAAKRRRSSALAAAAALIALGVAVGFERRTAGFNQEREQADAAFEQLASAAPAKDLRLAGSDATIDILERELARLRATRNKQATIGVADATAPLAALLARWPRDARGQTQSISVGPGQIGVTVSAPAHDEAERISAALGTVAGWQSAQPQITATGNGVQLQLTLRPSAATSKGGAP